MKRKLLTLFLLLATVFSVFAILNTVEAATPDTLYLKPSSEWLSDGARFAAYFFGNGEKWVSMTDSDSDGVYEVSVPSGFSKVIFCRMNGSTTANNWDNKWSQTGDLDIPTNGDNTCYIRGWSETAWGVLGGDVPTPSAPNVSINGDLVAAGWSGQSMVDADGDLVYELELELAAGTYEFKIVVNGSWYGNDGNIEDHTHGYGWEMNGGSNCKLTATGGIYKFSYNSTNNQLTVAKVTVVDVKAELNGVLTPFYNSGSYTKVTSIKVSAEKLTDEAAVYFHAGCNNLDRTTVYTTGKLTMTTATNISGSGYADGVNGMDRFHIEGENEVVDYTVQETSVEEYYVTLHDFLQASSTSNYGTFDLATGWTADNGVYTNTNTDVLEAFKLFVAPMWIGGANYVTFTKATVTVDNGVLVMQLWASSENSGLFADDYQAVDGHYLFAEARITA